MSAERSRDGARADAPDAAPRGADMTRLRARRRDARRRKRLARIDLGIGLFAALLLLILTPGLAIAAVIALAALAAVVVSVVHQRRRGARESDGQPDATPAVGRTVVSAPRDAQRAAAEPVSDRPRQRR